MQSASSHSSVLIDGLKLLASRIDNDLKTEDVKMINVELGGKFDPRIHEAVASQEIDDKPEGIILSVVANGYTIGKNVIKPALIKVSRRKPPAAPKEVPVEAPKEIQVDDPEKEMPLDDPREK